MLTPQEALRDPQVNEGGFMNWKNVPGWDEALPFIAPYTMSGNPQDPAPSPAMGQGARAVLNSYGFSNGEIDDLHRNGVVDLGVEA